MAAANPSRALVIVAGLAEAVAGAAAMGSGPHLASNAEENPDAAEIRDEGAADHGASGARDRGARAGARVPSTPRAQAERRLRSPGYTNPNVFLRTKIRNEPGPLTSTRRRRARRRPRRGRHLSRRGDRPALAVRLAFPPPHRSCSPALRASLRVALFALGIAKRRVASDGRAVSGIQGCRHRLDQRRARLRRRPDRRKAGADAKNFRRDRCSRAGTASSASARLNRVSARRCSAIDAFIFAGDERFWGPRYSVRDDLALELGTAAMCVPYAICARQGRAGLPLSMSARRGLSNLWVGARSHAFAEAHHA